MEHKEELAQPVGEQVQVSVAKDSPRNFFIYQHETHRASLHITHTVTAERGFASTSPCTKYSRRLNNEMLKLTHNRAPTGLLRLFPPVCKTKTAQVTVKALPLKEYKDAANVTAERARINKQAHRPCQREPGVEVGYPSVLPGLSTRVQMFHYSLSPTSVDVRRSETLFSLSAQNLLGSNETLLQKKNFFF